MKTIVVSAVILLGLAASASAQQCRIENINGRPVKVCRQGDADCWRVGPLQHCEYRPNPWWGGGGGWHNGWRHHDWDHGDWGRHDDWGRRW
jgi:hypothetical protein